MNALEDSKCIGYLSEIAVKTESFGINTHGVALFVYWDAMMGVGIDPKTCDKETKYSGNCAII